MEPKDNPRHEVQCENSGQQRRPDQNSLARRVLHHQRALSRVLRQALLDLRKENKGLAAENAALREQTASRELSWEQEKKMLLDEKDSLLSTLFMARNDMESLVKALESARASQKQFDTQHEEINRLLEEKKEEICSLRESLHFQKMETEKVKKSWKAEQDQFNEVKLSFDKAVTQLNEEWKMRWIIRQREVGAELETLQQDCEKKVSQVIQEKDDLITSVRKEMVALEEGSLAMLRAKEMEIHQSETVRKEVEEKWLNKESKMEEEIKLLIQKNVELQELALKTDKEKAKIKKEEKSAKKETGMMFRVLTLFSERK